MNTFRLFILTFLCIASAIPKAEAILDIFTVYSTRNNTIKKIVLEALGTPTKKWERTSAPIPEEYGNSSIYVPEGLDRRNPSTYFYFDEINYAKHPTRHNLKDLYIHITNEAIGKGCSFNIICQDEKTLAFETYNSSDKVSQKLHEIYLIVDLGGSNFRNYTYGTKYENLTEEQKTFWIQLFRYMEDQIKYVRK
jgi:hypothetical protein